MQVAAVGAMVVGCFFLEAEKRCFFFFVAVLSFSVLLTRKKEVKKRERVRIEFFFPPSLSLNPHHLSFSF